MHTTTMTKADRAALENLWGTVGTWTADTWTHLNTTYFGGKAKYHGVTWGLTPHGKRLGHTWVDDGGAGVLGRITLHPALLDPRGNAWEMGPVLGARLAEHVLLHEMLHAYLGDRGLDASHNSQPWCDEIMRITPLLGLAAVQAEPVKPRRVDGKVVRLARDGFLSRDDLAHWPHTLMAPDYYNTEGRITVLT